MRVNVSNVSLFVVKQKYIGIMKYISLKRIVCRNYEFYLFLQRTIGHNIYGRSYI